MYIINLLLSGLLFWSTASPAADYTNSIGMQFKDIPSGKFFMGSCKLSEENKIVNEALLAIDAKTIPATCPSGATLDNNASDNETPQHQVIISRAFQISIYEVTVTEFKKFITEMKRNDLLTENFTQNNNHSDNAAVTSVSWNDTQDFIRWLNKKENTNTYRLPTEAEWEYIARGGTDTLYSWGNKASSADSYAWFYDNAFHKKASYAHIVGQKQENPFGLYDIHGNVWEWTADWYSDDYYKYSTRYDPNGRGAGRYRVNRGGSWYNNSRDQHLRSANRGFNLPDVRSRTIGFRLLKQQPF